MFYRDGDEIFLIYFLVKGDVSFILPRYKNTSFLNVEIGEVFGIHDIFASMVINDLPMD